MGVRASLDGARAISSRPARGPPGGRGRRSAERLQAVHGDGGLGAHAHRQGVGDEPGHPVEHEGPAAAHGPAELAPPRSSPRWSGAPPALAGLGRGLGAQLWRSGEGTGAPRPPSPLHLPRRPPPPCSGQRPQGDSTPSARARRSKGDVARASGAPERASAGASAAATPSAFSRRPDLPARGGGTARAAARADGGEHVVGLVGHQDDVRRGGGSSSVFRSRAPWCRPTARPPR